ncbi:hypothetical protein LbFV_ORF100 [Leptopilina boulardi filamentous virus]|uniref:Uncharacterized protein n=1 Tax=Leptopilina boulardi filamentous virus TaxID=552509 RepID=A0A1S5YD18_9VIRU|nr:hypothetical protein LbFV_ORF100 [Leptopilina boulardi filamentous virus]AQQ80020.1 hypothetical protein LbFV_ORF100 [Leptopilina boulardi filamentous virus]
MKRQFTFWKAALIRLQQNRNFTLLRKWNIIYDIDISSLIKYYYSTMFSWNGKFNMLKYIGCEENASIQKNDNYVIQMITTLLQKATNDIYIEQRKKKYIYKN